MKIKALFLMCGLVALPIGVVTASSDMGSSKTMPPPMTSKTAAEFTCADFLDLEESYQPYLVGWAEGFSSNGTPEDEVLDVEGIDTIVPYVITVCQQNKSAPFVKKVKGVMNREMPKGTMPNMPRGKGMGMPPKQRSKAGCM